MTDSVISKTTDNAAVAGRDGGRGMANIVYILYIVGFFTVITALVGVVLAYVNRGSAVAPYDTHFSHQIRIFWRGVFLLVVSAILYGVTGVIGVATMGLGMILAIIPFGIGLYWLIWTIIQIIKGMQSLGRAEPI